MTGYFATESSPRNWGLSRWARPAWLLFISAGLAGACGGSDENEGGGTSASGKQTLCNQMCAKFELCDSSTDETDCADDCAADQGLSYNAQQAVTRCTEEAACNELTTSTYVDCIGDAFRELAPSATAQTFCSESAAKFEECLAAVDENQIEQECLEGVGALADSYVAALTECLSDPCDQVDTCTSRVEDDFNAGSGQFGGCCAAGDPCGRSNNGECDCNGQFLWDIADCAG